MRKGAIWGAVIAGVLVPLVAVTQSPLLAWRDPIYILAGFAGVIGMTLLFLQPLLAVGALPGLPAPRGRRLHRVVGTALVAAIVIHIGGLWITSPPDVIDVLLFRSPTPFGIWGAIAMWGVFGTAIWAALRRPLKRRPDTWRKVHLGLACLIVTSTLAHALLIEGTMGLLSKWGLAGLVAGATAWAIWKNAARLQSTTGRTSSK